MIKTRIKKVPVIKERIIKVPVIKTIKVPSNDPGIARKIERNYKDILDVEIDVAKQHQDFKGLIKDMLDIPVKFIGLGEKPEDIAEFEPERFVEALFSC